MTALAALRDCLVSGAAGARGAGGIEHSFFNTSLASSCSYRSQSHLGRRRQAVPQHDGTQLRHAPRQAAVRAEVVGAPVGKGHTHHEPSLSVGVQHHLRVRLGQLCQFDHTVGYGQYVSCMVAGAWWAKMHARNEAVQRKRACARVCTAASTRKLQSIQNSSATVDHRQGMQRHRTATP